MIVVTFLFLLTLCWSWMVFSKWKACLTYISNVNSLCFLSSKSHNVTKLTHKTCTTQIGALTACLSVCVKQSNTNNNPSHDLIPMETRCYSRGYIQVTAVCEPVKYWTQFVCVFTLWVSCEEDMQSSLRPCSSRGRPLMLCWSFLLPAESGDRCVLRQPPEGRIPRNPLSPVKMWRAITRRISTILGSLQRLQAGRNGRSRVIVQYVVSVARPAAGWDAFCLFYWELNHL